MSNSAAASQEVATHELAQELVTAAFASAFRRQVGRGRRIGSIQELHRQLGETIPVRTLESYSLAEALPGLVNFLRISSVLGPKFLNELLELVGLTGAHQAPDGEVNGHALLAHHAHATAELARAMADGRLDHVEKRELLPVLRDLVAKTQAAIAALDGEVTVQ